jgi:flagellar motility protein MotE (MotC chaperone)
MGSISSAQLKQILEMNSKMCEIYLEVNSECETIIESLKEIKDLLSNHSNFSEKNIEKINSILDALDNQTKENKRRVEEKNDKMLDLLYRIDKSLFRQNIILLSSFSSIAIGIIAKLFGIHL